MKSRLSRMKDYNSLPRILSRDLNYIKLQKAKDIESKIVELLQFQEKLKLFQEMIVKKLTNLKKNLEKSLTDLYTFQVKISHKGSK